MASSRVGTSLRTRRGPYLVFQVFVLFLLMNRRLSRLGSSCNMPYFVRCSKSCVQCGNLACKGTGENTRTRPRGLWRTGAALEVGLPPERSSDLVGARRAEIDLVLIAGIGERGVDLIGHIADPE